MAEPHRRSSTTSCPAAATCRPRSTASTAPCRTWPTRPADADSRQVLLARAGATRDDVPRVVRPVQRIDRPGPAADRRHRRLDQQRQRSRSPSSTDRSDRRGHRRHAAGRPARPARRAGEEAGRRSRRQRGAAERQHHQRVRRQRPGAGHRHRGAALGTAPNVYDATRQEVVGAASGNVLSGRIGGGALGALLDFRSNVLDPAQNAARPRRAGAGRARSMRSTRRAWISMASSAASSSRRRPDACRRPATTPAARSARRQRQRHRRADGGTGLRAELRRQQLEHARHAAAAPVAHERHRHRRRSLQRGGLSLVVGGGAASAGDSFRDPAQPRRRGQLLAWRSPIRQDRRRRAVRGSAGQLPTPAPAASPASASADGSDANLFDAVEHRVHVADQLQHRRRPGSRPSRPASRSCTTAGACSSPARRRPATASASRPTATRIGDNTNALDAGQGRQSRRARRRRHQHRPCLQPAGRPGRQRRRAGQDDADHADRASTTRRWPRSRACRA